MVTSTRKRNAPSRTVTLPRVSPGELADVLIAVEIGDLALMPDVLASQIPGFVSRRLIKIVERRSHQTAVLTDFGQIVLFAPPPAR